MRNRWINVLTVLAVGGALACGGGEGGEAETDAAGETAPAAAPAVDPATAATVQGVVNFEGTPPPAEEIDMSEEPTCAEQYTDAPMTEEVVVSDGRLANVFVYVKEGLEGSFPTPSEPVELDQAGCRYEPRVVGIQTGQTLLIKNSDGLLHNINTQPTVNRGFNISQPQAGMESEREFSRPEVMIPVKCDVHGWMSAYLGVLDHPYYAVSGSDGSFEISNLPPGTYVVEAWHEVYGTQTQELTVGESETAEISFTYSADMGEGVEVPLGEPVIVSHRADGMTEASVTPGPAGR